MKNAQILIVEDENIVALDIQNRLKRLGYGVLAVASSGKEAIQKASGTRPDLVLMDIMLKGDMDGVETAKKLQEFLDVPVVYLTAYTDDSTLRRAKVTEPYGYILKPFEERDLHINIEIALYKHEMERKLKESEKHYHTLVKVSPVGVFNTDAEGRCLYVNERWCEITGLTMVEVLGEDWSRALHPDDRERALTEWYQATKKKLSFKSEYRFIRPGSVITWVLGQGIPEIAETGEVMSYVGTITDITERKQMEECIRQHNEELEELVEKRAMRIKELERQRMESEKLAAVGRMAARVAHEINNPLGGIKTSFLLIKDAVPENHQYYQYVGMVEKEIGRITRIVRQMFDLCRPNQERPGKFDARATIRDVITMLKYLGEEHSVDINLEPCEESIVVTMSEDMLRQVLFNIIKNAIEASPRVGLVNVAVKISDKALTIIVSDQGSGIPDELRSQIFEPFFTTKSKGSTGGLGLGLSTTQSIVEANGGSIDFMSGKNKGTVFTIELPIMVNDKKR
ncbi:MAG: ATP-binding protein [Candidatus Scalinduaceae bacterium]